jgi:bifunctional DNA-binding transcriptional regulator/antitoxin component of YhaV-PrlF toxin-antitoxin module
VNAVLNENGQIEIPRALREQLGLQPGNVLELQNQAGTLVGWKKVEPDVFATWRGRGALPTGANTDNYLRLIRDGDLRGLIVDAVNDALGLTECGLVGGAQDLVTHKAFGGRDLDWGDVERGAHSAARKTRPEPNQRGTEAVARTQR